MSEPTWADGPLIGFDLETTGVDVESDRIVTATVVRLVPGRDPVIARWLVAVDVDIPAEATAIHGITTEHAREHGRPAADVVPEIKAALMTGWAGKAVIVGHNVVFDLSMLDRELRRWADSSFAIVGPVADSLALDRAVDKYRRGSRNLGATAEHYQVPHNGAHDSTEDALASCRIVWRLCRQYPQVGAMSARELWRYQRAAYREWAMHYEDYRRRKLRDEGGSVAAVEAIVIPTEWPLYPLPAATDPEPTGARP